MTSPNVDEIISLLEDHDCNDHCDNNKAYRDYRQKLKQELETMAGAVLAYLPLANIDEPLPLHDLRMYLEQYIHPHTVPLGAEMLYPKED